MPTGIFRINLQKDPSSPQCESLLTIQKLTHGSICSRRASVSRCHYQLLATRKFNRLATLYIYVCVCACVKTINSQSRLFYTLHCEIILEPGYSRIPIYDCVFQSLTKALGYIYTDCETYFRELRELSGKQIVYV